MNIFISGGCKNGKSYHAQRCARAMAESNGSPLYYLATMDPHDDEDRARIRRHLRDRDGWGFATLEQPVDICSCLRKPGVDAHGVFLLDSVTALMANEMFDSGLDPDEAAEKTKDDLCRFAELTGNTVFVSDGIYSDAFLHEELTGKYRRALAAADMALAQICDKVTEVAYGNITEHKQAGGI